MYFALPLILVAGFYVFQELRLRRREGLPLDNARDLGAFLLRKQRAPVWSKLRRATPAYLVAFAFIGGACFGLWESTLWALFGHPGNFALGVLGLALLIALTARRARRARSLSSEARPGTEILLVWIAFALCLQPAFTIVLFTPWIAIRAYRLPTPGPLRA